MNILIVRLRFDNHNIDHNKAGIIMLLSQIKILNVIPTVGRNLLVPHEEK